MNKRIGVALFVILVQQLAYGADTKPALGERTPVIKPEFFSFCPPVEWKAGRVHELGDQVAMRGPIENGYAPNMIFSVMSAKEGLDDYIAKQIKILELPSAERKELKTESGVKIIKLIISFPAANTPSKKAFYFLVDAGRNALVTASASLEGFDKAEPVFDSVMTHFIMEPFPEVALRKDRYESSKGFSLLLIDGLPKPSEDRFFSVHGQINNEYYSIYEKNSADNHTLKEFIEIQSKAYKTRAILESSDFKTESVTGIRQVIQGESQKNLVFYFDDGKGTKFEFALSGPESKFPLLDSCMKSLKFEDKK